MKRVNQLEIDHRAEERHRKLTAAATLKRKASWAKAFSELSPAQQETINGEREEFEFVRYLMLGTDELDLAYAEALAFITSFPLVNSWLPIECIGSMTEIQWAAFDDRVFADYGIRTRITHLEWTAFNDRVARWSKDHFCDEDVLTEVEAFIERNQWRDVKRTTLLVESQEVA